MTPSCGTCRYAEPVIVHDEPGVECRRYPPTLVPQLDTPGLASQSWPVIQLDDWCGEHQPREDQ